MIIKITQEQFRELIKMVDLQRVTCNVCGWSWKLSEGGHDPYICHKCGNNNEE
jgi:tRNA(Ile2) C34 agmatinyltransferase TiaS